MKREISFTTGEYRDRINDIRRLQSLTPNEAYLATPGGFEKSVTFERKFVHIFQDLKSLSSSARERLYNIPISLLPGFRA